MSNIQKNQSKAMDQFTQKFDNKQEVKDLTEKLRGTKDEYKYSKDLLKACDNKIKNQNNVIFTLSEKNQKIRDNIEHKKKQDNYLKDNQVNINIKKYFIFFFLIIKQEDQNENVEIKFELVNSQVQNEEKHYKTEIAKQLSNISKLTEEVNLYNLQYKEKEQAIRINELKMKEIAKFNKIANNLEENKKGLKDHKYPTKLYNNRAISANLRVKKDNNNIVYSNNHTKTPTLAKLPNKFYNSRPFSINDVKFETAKNKTEKSYFKNLENEEMIRQMENLSKFKVLTLNFKKTK